MHTPRHRTHSPVFTILAALVTAAAPLAAGPVSPPAGAVGPTMKTLAEVEARTALSATNTPGDAGAVFRITQAGSYYLTGNVVASGSFNGSGIVIAANNVTLDLNGFTVQGPLNGPGSSKAGVQINGATYAAIPPFSVGENPHNITVRNGVIRGWGQRGVDARSSGGVGSNVPNVKLEGLTVSECTGDGISVADKGTLTDCKVSECGGASGNGFRVDKCHLTRCTASNNAHYGYAGDNSHFSNCVSTDNIGMGFVVNYSTLEGCSSTGCGLGYFLNSGSSATNCTAINNQGTGISLIGGSSAVNCTASRNGHDVNISVGGFQVDSDCRVDGCTAVDNQNAGFKGQGASRALVVRCYASSNGSGPSDNYLFFSAANAVGPIITTAGTISSTNPWANFSY